MRGKHLADSRSARKHAHNRKRSLSITPNRGPQRADAATPHFTDAGIDACPFSLGNYLTTRRCDGCGTVIDTAFDDPDHICGLCDGCWSGLAPTQQADREWQVLA